MGHFFQKKSRPLKIRHLKDVWSLKVLFLYQTLESESVHVNGNVSDSTNLSSDNHVREKLEASSDGGNDDKKVTENGSHSTSEVLNRPDPTGTPDELSSETSALENSSGSRGAQSQNGSIEGGVSLNSSNGTDESSSGMKPQLMVTNELNGGIHIGANSMQQNLACSAAAALDYGNGAGIVDPPHLFQQYQNQVSFEVSNFNDISVDTRAF